MSARRSVVYLQNGAAPADRPTVRISKTNEGVTFSVSATGRSLNLARIRAEKAYRALSDFVTELERRERQRVNDEINRGHVKAQEKA